MDESTCSRSVGSQMASGAVVIRLPVPLMLFMDIGHMSLGLDVNKQDPELPGP